MKSDMHENRNDIAMKVATYQQPPLLFDAAPGTCCGAGGVEAF